ncbi:MAG: formate--tetrahydrofolate ligase [Deferribacteres bacterium]|nr:formate--tetrahydrofolate ligase [candidate division KSB1 bacterium]MCB9508609.1 formate--tetrahydrofolate ligase [Deferribacteres bacterium]
MQTSIEIAQKVTLKPIREIMEGLGLADEDVEFYGKYNGKVRLQTLQKFSSRPDGKLILVTAMTPTSHGEGKTLTSVGLGQALAKIGKKGMIALREPSLGPVFGIKGGATGGGYAQVLPMEDINLHFNGDIHAIGAAHNLLAAMVDNHMLKSNDLRIDPTNVLWNRAMDMNDRSLRQIVIGLGGRINGIPRESGFVITAASEVMAILALATSRADLKKRLGNIVVGFDLDSGVVTAEQLQAHKAMAVILNEAIMPNLVQTIEHTPALIHAGPFANIAHGTSSVLADRIALKLADYVVTESGFGADLGAEKFFDIVCRQSGLWPSTVVVVATCRAIKLHGGVPEKPEGSLEQENPDAFNKGLGNLEVHVRNMKKFGVPVLVAINRFPYDRPSEIAMVEELCQKLEVACVSHQAFNKGGEGAAALAQKAVQLAESAGPPRPKFIYDLELPVEDKIRKIATEIYGADGVYYEKRAMKKLEKFAGLGYGNLPVCIAKTQASLSDNPRAQGVPKGWMLTVTDANLSAGAGFLVISCGEMMLMPGLPKLPAAINMDVDENGKITGLF